jgi:hypothetical protein
VPGGPVLHPGIPGHRGEVDDPLEAVPGLREDRDPHVDGARDALQGPQKGSEGRFTDHLHGSPRRPRDDLPQEGLEEDAITQGAWKAYQPWAF